MTIENTSSRLKIFWTLNISGWSVLIGSIVLIYASDFNEQSDLASHYTYRYFIGFLVSIILAYYYNKIDFHKKSPVSGIVSVIVYFILTIHLWYLFGSVVQHYILAHQEKESINSIYFHDMFWNIVYLGLWSAFFFGIKFWMDLSEEKDRREKVEALAKNAQLRMLRYQLNPHFLFNSLNSIRALIDESQDRAQRMISELKEFLNYSLKENNNDTVLLKDELKSLRHYFAIEKERYEEKLDISIQIDNKAENYPILSFLLHPVVDNAVKYGMQTSVLPLKITIKADIGGNGELKLLVSNSGKWIENHPDETINSSGTGTGLDNVRLRLKYAYPGQHKFSTQVEEDIVKVYLEINSLDRELDE